MQQETNAAQVVSVKGEIFTERPSESSAGVRRTHSHLWAGGNRLRPAKAGNRSRLKPGLVPHDFSDHGIHTVSSMRITETQLAILEMLTWHVRAATDSQIQQMLNDQSLSAHASDILRRLANDGWVYRRQINVAVPVLSKPLCSWSPNQSKPNFASLAWQLFVRHICNGQRTSLADGRRANHENKRSRLAHHPTPSLSTAISLPDSTSETDPQNGYALVTDTTSASDSSPTESLSQSGRQPHIVNWATPKAANLLAGCTGWGRQPFQLEHDLGTTAIYVSSRPYQSDVIWYGEDIVRRRFSAVNKKVPDVLLVDRHDNILKVVEYGGQYSRHRLEDFHHTWKQYPWEIW